MEKKIKYSIESDGKLVFFGDKTYFNTCITLCIYIQISVGKHFYICTSKLCCSFSWKSFLNLCFPSLNFLWKWKFITIQIWENWKLRSYLFSLLFYAKSALICDMTDFHYWESFFILFTRLVARRIRKFKNKSIVPRTISLHTSSIFIL